ncbi:hypothetical protein [Paludisphaera soli]|uniref:hypothetical protein n=1 Tax=Paludisphaera soli TaxID=2712865 RepID=UPI0013EA69D2|nr:hypothetical protein [Paludisphaera soli]
MAGILVTNPIRLDDLIRLVQERFRDGPPNGWLLGWDPARCLDSVGRAARPHHVGNTTSFDYGFCNQFEVAIGAGGRGECWVLTIHLSFVAPTFCLFWTRYKSPNKGVVNAGVPEGQRALEDEVRAAIQAEGFFELPDEWFDVHVDGVRLELSDAADVTLNKCLFCDYDG